MNHLGEGKVAEPEDYQFLAYSWDASKQIMWGSWALGTVFEDWKKNVVV